MCKLPIIVFVLIMTSVPAVAVQDLYSGEVAVSDKSEERRADAIPDALIQVLQKLSGQREIPNSPVVDNALQNASRIMFSFRYKKAQRLAPDGSATDELYLVARFMRSEVDRILRQAGLPRWQMDRPVVQVWVVVDDGRSRALQPLEYQYAWQAMQDLSARRGLQVIRPDLDAEELQLIDMRLVWGGFTDDLVRWGVPGDGLLIVAAHREGPQWNLAWSLASGEEHWRWHTADRDLRFALAAGIHRTVDEIAAVNTIAAADMGEWTTEVTIEDINSGDDYTRCLAYLEGQGLVTSVEVLAAEPGRAHFRLQLSAAPKYLSEAFQRAGVLQPLDPFDNSEYRFLH